ncbi:aldehyde:ferredoxin oxidoreductase [Malonomonas rubra DSM 5091]|uniref:Aldehyde:ferredoxin oxidoreductase n=1 Tax=Malonomonas rubra DSM 5091 TaxID=1122189 RepID=A0A1M6L481_MALRU|nr:aldehyde ferredoxin oxidoreductase N-terminal domain-containing protein [Malonomonas rubra]SHJ65914.1 aldehyde:ferredoxin oxidoreductase [Malonomonas rubra DSM 5091]
MTLYGYAGKILRLDMTNRKAIAIDTEPYRRWGGGHGMGSALFWDFCKNKTITDGRDPANVCCVVTSPLNGTIVPSAGGRCEVVGVGVGQYPISWYTRTNFGGRFSTMLKYAGWDAIVIEGKADRPVWVDIRNDQVYFHNAQDIWGKDTWTAQHDIRKLTGTKKGTKTKWQDLDALPQPENVQRSEEELGRTTQKPAILCIGTAGETQACHACLIHDAGNGAGQGGFGAVWGSKNLKAISVLGTGAIEVHDPKTLIQARVVTKEKYVSSWQEPDFQAWTRIGRLPNPIIQVAPPTSERRPQSCQGCINGCRSRYKVGYGNESACQETSWYGPYVRRVAKSRQEDTEINLKAADLVQQYGLNSFVFQTGLHWLEHLHEEGVLGPGRKIPSDLPWEKLGTLDFAEKIIHALSTRTDIGADLADGWIQAALKWGREEDLHTGALQFSYWGVPEHGYDPRAELEWGYGSIMGDRDMNLHCFNYIFTNVSAAFAFGKPLRISAEELVNLHARKMAPYAKDRPEVLDFSDANMYSEAVAQLVRWQQHYCRFYKNSALFCDLKWPDFFNTNVPDLDGATASADAGEQVFWNAVTGDNLSFEDGIEIGRQIWNLDNAIWTLQGRHRDIVHFSPYIYKTKFNKGELFPFYMWTTRDEQGEWHYTDLMGRSLEKDKFDEWKTIFYQLEGWDTKTGWPTRSTLEKMDMAFVADELQGAGRLGEEKS